MEVFTRIYRDQIWGSSVLPGVSGSSGSGSDPRQAKKYLLFLQKFLHDPERKIRSVVDLGCGDGRLTRLIDWSGISYIGIDCVPDLIKYHQENSPGKYRCVDFLHSPQDLPGGDLCILKDVLHHWPNEDVVRFLTYLIENRLYRYILLINCSCQMGDERKILLGGFAPLSPGRYPLNKFSSIPVLSYGTKIVSLISL